MWYLFSWAMHFHIIVQLWGAHSLEQMEHSWLLNTLKHQQGPAWISKLYLEDGLAHTQWNQLSHLNTDTESNTSTRIQDKHMKRY